MSSLATVHWDMVARALVLGFVGATWHRAVKLLLQVSCAVFDSLPSSSLSSVVLACVVTRNPAARTAFFAAFSRRRGLLSIIRAASATQRSLAPRGAVVLISRPRYGDEAAPAPRPTTRAARGVSPPGAPPTNTVPEKRRRLVVGKNRLKGARRTNERETSGAVRSRRCRRRRRPQQQPRATSSSVLSRARPPTA